MAKKRKAVTGEVIENPTVQAAAAVASRPPGNPMPIANPGPQVQLDIRVTTQDLVDIAVGEQSEQLVLERDARETDLSSEMATHQKLVKRLDNAAENLIESTAISDEVRRLVAMLSEFSGDNYKPIVVSVNAPTYRYSREEKQSNEPEVNLKKLQIIGEIRIVKRDETIVASRKITIDFTDNMKQLVEEIESQAVKVRDVEEQLIQVKRKIADLPRMALRAKNEMTKAYLRGELTDTRSMLETVMATPVRALPPARCRSDD